MSTIFELSQEQAEILALVTNETLTQEDIADTLEALDMEIEDKINAYCSVHRELNIQLEAIKAEQAKLAEFKKTKENEIKRLKETFKSGLIQLDKTKFDTGLFKGHIRKGSQSVNVLDSNQVPEQYIERVMSVKVDKTAIKNALKAGETVEGAELVTGESSLIIK